MLLCELLLPNSRCIISVLAVAAPPKAIELSHLLPAFFSYLRHPESMGLLFLPSTILTFPFKSLNCTSPMIFGSSPTGRSVGELANHKHTYKLFVGAAGQSQFDANIGKFLSAAHGADMNTGFVCGDGLSDETHLYGAGNSEYHNNISSCKATNMWQRIS